MPTETRPINECIYCGRIAGLTDEHALAQGLGGTIVLKKASCERCRKRTHEFESFCLTYMFPQHLRARHGIKTKHKSNRRKAHTQRYRNRSNSEIRTEEIPIEQMPIIIPGYHLPPPGIIQGNAPSNEIKGTLSFMHSEELVSALSEREGFQFGSYHDAYFLRMLAKIAHASTIAMWGYGTFEPLLRDIIRGKSDLFPYFIGGSEGPPPRDTKGLHSVEARRQDVHGRDCAVATIQLFRPYGAPAYDVVVGDYIPPTHRRKFLIDIWART